MQLATWVAGLAVFGAILALLQRRAGPDAGCDRRWILAIVAAAAIPIAIWLLTR